MKNLILILSLSLIFLHAKVESWSKNVNKNIQKYDNIFEQIDRQRVGLDDSKIDKIPEPFVSKRVFMILKDKNVTVNKPLILKLYGIFNKKVKINTKWYKIGSKVFGYKVIKVKDNSVVLRYKRKRLELFLRKRDENIQISKNN